jgi:DMSO/TMAO reductase YedYZ molybdopterin-dependent catalytic subunit
MLFSIGRPSPARLVLAKPSAFGFCAQRNAAFISFMRVSLIMKNALFAPIILVLVILAGCLQPQGPVTLKGVEVSNYSGNNSTFVNLSSVNDFRENSIHGPQYIDENSYRLRVSGLVDNPKEYTYQQVLAGHQAYEKVVTLNCVEGWSVTILWEGVLVRDLLKEAGPKPDAKTVIVKAYDGYSSQFPIEYFYDNDILMAYKMNNVTIPPERGFPFMLVAEDKWGYKWVKWITGIELSNDTNYQGYWESRGYSDTGNLNQSFIK